MSTDAVGSAAAAAASSAATSKTGASSISKDDFLKILMCQLQNQDPLNPTDANAFVTELSQLTQVETLQNIQKDISTLSSSLQQGNVGQWVSAIGGYMQVNDTKVSSGDKVLLYPSGDYDTITVALKKPDGTTTEKKVTSTDSPVFDVDQSYTVTGVSATKDGKSVSCSAAVYRYITGVQPGTSGTLLSAGDGTTYAASDVILITK